MKKLLIAVLLLLPLGLSAQTPPPSPYPDDVAVFTAGTKYAWAVTNNFNLDACVEREMHDGQWLAGGCKDGLFLLRRGLDGFFTKAVHIGGAVMANAQHGNASYQVKGGLNLGTLGQGIQNGLALAAPSFGDYIPPPWVSKIGNAITIDFFGGPRPVHDASVNGNWTYGVGAMVNVPLQTTFAWLISGL